jgi:hypothetical protein
MRVWKKVVIGGLTGVTLAGGANIAASAGTRGDNPARQESRVDVRQEDRQADRRENEARGRDAEGENEAGDVRHENEARGREAEGENHQRGGADALDTSANSGPGSANSGPGSATDDSGHHGRDDG